MSFRTRARSLYLSFAGWQRKPRAGVHILNGHVAALAITERVATFRGFVKFLQSECVLADVCDAVSLLQEGKTVTDPVVALTFDDAFEDFAEVIGPELQASGVRGAFFINCGLLRDHAPPDGLRHADIETYGRNMMNVEQLVALSKYHVIGSHGYGHLRYSDISEQMFREDVELNEQLLKQHVGVAAKWFAWPYGRRRDIRDEQLLWLRQRYDVVCSSYRRSARDGALERRHIEPFWPQEHVRYFLAHGGIRPSERGTAIPAERDTQNQ